MKIYLATAYRWGNTNTHNYLIYVGTDMAKALAMASAECLGRGGKYGCEVMECGEDENRELTQTPIAYFPSGRETAPFHNYTIDMFLALGHRFHEFADGVVYLPAESEDMKDRDGKPLKILKPTPMVPPQWVIDEKNRQESLYDILRGHARR